MPLLDDSDLRHMREYEAECRFCQGTLRKNYCRQCDEFYVYGHSATCVQFRAAEHLGHRKYAEVR